MEGCNLWYRNAIVYEINSSLFHDSTGDGWGDLRGLTQRLDHVRGLGATALCGVALPDDFDELVDIASDSGGGQDPGASESTLPGYGYRWSRPQERMFR